MKKTELRIVALVLLIVAVIISFVPVFFQYEYWVSNKGLSHTRTSFYGMNLYALGNVFGYAALVLFVLGMVVQVMGISGSKAEWLGKAAFLPTVALLCLLISFFTVPVIVPQHSSDQYLVDAGLLDTINYNEYSVAWGLYLEMAVAAVYTAINALILKAPEDVPAPKPTAASGNAVQQLSQLKSLLDAGVITQDEFDEKKKKLLG